MNRDVRFLSAISSCGSLEYNYKLYLKLSSVACSANHPSPHSHKTESILDKQFFIKHKAFPSIKQSANSLNIIARMEAEKTGNYCYTGKQSPISMQQPGQPCALPQYLLKEFKELFPNMKKRQVFFGGHPVSITRQSCQQIFTLKPNKPSPYLVCQKTDGVRYLLVVARIFKRDIMRSDYLDEPLITQCYFISRKGYNALDAFVADVGISYEVDFASAETSDTDRRFVVEILDGELVKQHHKGKDYFKYLIFDALVHLGRNICPMPLKQRLQCVNKFLQCNQMLGVPPCTISIQLKDFFRLVNRKFNTIEFLLKKYVNMMEHENDGLIFNHEEKQYLLGTTNPGYIKWKPEHLNTVDFMIVPNLNLEDKFGRKVLDLYVAVQDKDLDRYTRQFYAFTVVSERDFEQVSLLLQKKEEEKFKKREANEEEHTAIDEFTGSVIAECRFDQTKGVDEKITLSALSKEPMDELRMNLMKQGDEEKDFNALREFSKKIFDKNWHIYKIRQDKSLPNNVQVVKKIEQSIKDGITAENLLLKGKEIRDRAFSSF